MVTKNKLCRVHCERLDGQMNGIAHVDGQTVFIPGLLPDEEADIRIVKAEKRYAFGPISY